MLHYNTVLPVPPFRLSSPTLCVFGLLFSLLFHTCFLNYILADAIKLYCPLLVEVDGWLQAQPNSYFFEV